MNPSVLDLEKELESLPPEDAQSILRALSEMLKLARKKSSSSVTPKSGMHVLPSWNLGVSPGLDLTRLAHLETDHLAG